MARGSHASDDSGLAMLWVIMLMIVVAGATALMGSLIQGAQWSSRNSARTQTSAMTAESGVDTALAALESSVGLKVPCRWTSDDASGEESSTRNVTVSYFSDAEATDPIPCTDGVGVSVKPMAAFIKSMGVTGTGVAHQLEMLVRLEAVPGTYFDKAIFSEEFFGPSQVVSEQGNVGNDADIYSNGDISLSNNDVIAGSLQVYGDVTLAQTAQVLGSIWATGNISIDNNARVGGDVKTSGTNEPGSGNVDLGNNAFVGGSVYATGKVTGTGTVSGTRNNDQAGVVDPPLRPFPVVNYDAASIAKWQSQEFDILNLSCSQAETYLKGVSNAAIDSGKTAMTRTKPVVIRVTRCTVADGRNGSGVLTGAYSSGVKKGIFGLNFGANSGEVISLNTDVAVISDDGWNAVNNLTIKSTTTATRRMWMMTPSNSPRVVGEPYPNCPTVTSGPKTYFPGSITLENNALVQPSVKLFIFTPCRAWVSNNGTTSGMIYADVVDTKNNFAGQYYPMDVPGLVDTTWSYQVDTVYKREVPVS